MAYGKMDDFVYREFDFSQQVDAMGQTILPAWCDSHTHLVFAHSREEEFIDKIKGLSYAEIAARGGGDITRQEVERRLGKRAIQSRVRTAGRREQIRNLGRCRN